MAQKKYQKRKKAPSPGPYPFEIRLRVVRMYLEEQYPITLISEETGVGKYYACGSPTSYVEF